MERVQASRKDASLRLTVFHATVRNGEDPEPNLRRLAQWSLAALTGLACAATLLSTVDSDQWWVRVLDFPRILILLAVTSIAVLCMLFARRWRWPLLAALVVAAMLQAWRIYPYTSLAPIEVVTGSADASRSASCFTALGFNVLQHNRNYAATLAMITQHQPDLLLLMETDEKWAGALSSVLAHYPNIVRRPLDNTYGMIFASKLKVISARFENITDRDTPTVYARLETRDGRPFDYIGLHPRPPIPGQDTGLRDRKIAHAALAIDGRKIPAIAMGDFNDVAWSRTTQLFKQVGGFLDPRIGRGAYASFPTKYASLGWPLDQIFVSPEFVVRSLHILSNVGSDHRPLVVDLCLAPKNAESENAAPERVPASALRSTRAMTGK